MGAKEFGATVSLAAGLVAACGGPNPELPPPSPSAVPSTVSPGPNTTSPWPELAVQPCDRPGVYHLPDDPDPNTHCQISELLKGQIENHRPVRIDGQAVRVGDIGLQGVCIFNPLTIEVAENGVTNNYLGIAKIGPDGTAEVLTFPFRQTWGDKPITYNQVAMPETSEHLYYVNYKGMRVFIGVVRAAQDCPPPGR